MSAALGIWQMASLALLGVTGAAADSNHLAERWSLRGRSSRSAKSHAVRLVNIPTTSGNCRMVSGPLSERSFKRMRKRRAELSREMRMRGADTMTEGTHILLGFDVARELLRWLIARSPDEADA
jgi:hypothetical protein